MKKSNVGVLTRRLSNIIIKLKFQKIRKQKVNEKEFSVNKSVIGGERRKK